MNRPRLLWITPKWPLPMEDGARVATATLLREAARGADIDLLAVLPAGGGPPGESFAEPCAELGVRRAHLAWRSGTHTGFLRWLDFAGAALFQPRTPLTIAPFAAPAVRKKVRSLLNAGAWDFTILDGLHGAAAIPLGDPRLGRPVYRAHNVEADLWAQSRDRAASEWRRRLLRRQTRLVAEFERKIAAASALVLPVSENDARRFRTLLPGDGEKVSAVPIGQDFTGSPTPMPPPAGALRLLFVGTLDWIPNREGLQWFLDKIWPKAHLARPDLNIDIVGSGDGSWLETYRKDPSVVLHGRVAELAPLYARSSLTIAPLFMGSGTRVKAVEAARYQRACLSTELGVEGLDLRAGVTYLRAEGAEQWIAALASLTTEACARIGHAAHAALAPTYDAKAVGRQFLSRLQNISMPMK